MTLPQRVATQELLRCHSCSHVLGSTPEPMRLIALFRASAFGQLRSSHAQEVRRRCRSCGWVNVFHPLTGQATRFIVVKS